MNNIPSSPQNNNNSFNNSCNISPQSQNNNNNNNNNTSPSSQLSPNILKVKHKHNFNYNKDAGELVLLCGPHFVGKTFYYQSHYSNTHERVSAQELFNTYRNNDSNSNNDNNDNNNNNISESISFNKIITNYVLKPLEEGRNVLIDDTNHLATVRSSYLSAIEKHKIPISKIVLLNFIPSGGELQLKWSSAWYECEKSLVVHNNNSNGNNSNRIDLETFKFEFKQPYPYDGFSYVKDITVPLYFNTTKNHFMDRSFKNIALFLDSKTILEFSHQKINSSSNNQLEWNIKLKDNCFLPIKEWVKSSIYRRVIILLDEVSLFPISLDNEKEEVLNIYRDIIKNCFSELSKQIKAPLYYFSCPKDLPESDFYRFPNDLGLVAWAHHRHRLSLSSSTFIVDDNDLKIISTLPFNICLASNFFKLNNWKSDNKISNNLIENSINIPSFIENIQFVEFNNDSSNNEIEIEKGIPLFSKFKSLSVSSNNNCNKLSLTEEYLSFGKVHGAFFPTLIEDEIEDNKENIIGQEQQQQQQKSNDEIKLYEKGSIPHINYKCLKDFGCDDSSIRRGYDYYQESNSRISCLECSIVSGNSIKVNAFCQGTGVQPYVVSVRYRAKMGLKSSNENLSPILETACNCISGSKTFGKCKHIVTLIQHCNHLYSVPPPSPFLSSQASSISPNSSPSHSKNNNNSNNSNRTPTRKLPSWWSSEPSSDKLKTSPNKRTSNLYFPENKQRKVRQQLEFEPINSNNKPNNSNNTSPIKNNNLIKQFNNSQKSPIKQQQIDIFGSPILERQPSFEIDIDFEKEESELRKIEKNRRETQEFIDQLFENQKKKEKKIFIDQHQLSPQQKNSNNNNKKTLDDNYDSILKRTDSEDDLLKFVQESDSMRASTISSMKSSIRSSTSSNSSILSNKSNSSNIPLPNTQHLRKEFNINDFQLESFLDD